VNLTVCSFFFLPLSYIIAYAFFNLGKPVDMWSIGVILFVLLSGTLPFNESNDTATLGLIVKGSFAFAAPQWLNISSSVKDMICQLLTLNPSRRPTVDQALQHDWMITKDEILELKSLTASLPDLKKFQIRKKWKKGFHAVKALNRFKSFMKSPTSNSSSSNGNKSTHSPGSGFSTASLECNEEEASSVSLSSSLFSPVHHKESQTTAATTTTTIIKGKYIVYEKEIIRIQSNYKIKKAFNQETKESLGVKIINLEGLSLEERKLYYNETALLHELDHPNIVQLVDSYQSEDNKLYIFTELITGHELFDSLKEKKDYCEKQVRDLAKTLLLALNYLHDQGIVHR
jgi:serine/threonine protein kinase